MVSNDSSSGSGIAGCDHHRGLYGLDQPAAGFNEILLNALDGLDHPGYAVKELLAWGVRRAE